jgi:anti-sigma regulatory factor (Ser/Thr protein kinase)
MNELSKNITLVNEVNDISQLSGYIESIVNDSGIDPMLAMSLNLALEEAVTNVVLYAYPEGVKGEVDILTTIRDGVLTFVISDTGVAFDPTQKEDADVTLSAEERPIGGLGIFLVKQLMDTVSYERKDGRNILTLTKQL